MTADAPPPGGRRSYWLREALEAEGPAESPPIPAGNVNADVVIGGGGYTGLWTAFFLTDYAPGMSIVLLEQDICGGGASGRNGGFVTGWWDELSGMVRLFGEKAAVDLCRALGKSINAIGTWCEVHGVDAWFTRGGCLEVAAAPVQMHGLAESIEDATRAGVGDELRYLTAEEVRKRCASPLFLGGGLMRDGATVQPARLARGLRRVVLERGVRVYEQAAVRVFNVGSVCTARTETSTVTAPTAVLAVNAWAVGWPQLWRMTVARGSYIVLTEPIPDRLKDLGWTGGECITDLRTALHYFRTTRDGRIAFGGGGASTGLGPRVGKTFTHDAKAVARTAEGFRRIFPQLNDVRLVDSWGGAVDVSPVHLPLFGRVGTASCFYGLGYTGNGVGPSYLGGRVLAGMCLGRDDEWTSLALVNYRPPKFPPEPFRSIGARIVNRAIVEKDRQEERKPASNPLISLIAKLPSRMGYNLPPA